MEAASVSAEEGNRRIVVTSISTGPAEGKTLVVSNLAIALAQGGSRVLLIDADMRHHTSACKSRLA